MVPSEVMEGVEGLMGKLKLSEAEKGGVQIGGSGGGHKSRIKEPQAVGKVLTDRLISPETLERSLGKVWCPIRGVTCKDLGDNHFLVTFLQPTRKRRALEDGPWMISKDLVVMTDFDEAKTLDEMDFNHVPIWVRVSNLPIGMLDEETGAILGEKIGVFKEVDVGDDGLAMGRVLRIKVIIDIRNPLMRGIMVTVGMTEKEKWCPFAYEFLTDFCYVCGRIGHVDKQCEVRLEQGEKQQFSKSLRFIPERRKGDIFEDRRSQGFRPRGPWQSGSSGSRGSQDGRGGRWASSGSGSDALTWKKDAAPTEKGEEVKSPSKQLGSWMKDHESQNKKADSMTDEKGAKEGGKKGGSSKKKIKKGFKCINHDRAEKGGKGKSGDVLGKRGLEDEEMQEVADTKKS